MTNSGKNSLGLKFVLAALLIGVVFVFSGQILNGINRFFVQGEVGEVIDSEERSLGLAAGAASSKNSTSVKPSSKSSTSVKPSSINSAGLQPELAQAFESARSAASKSGITLVLNSGYRTKVDQQKLLDKEIAKRGSYEAAVKWVLPPKDSAHVKGAAIDIGPAAAASWLEENGSRWGLCRRYANESWHFELIGVPGRSCPALEANAMASISP